MEKIEAKIKEVVRPYENMIDYDAINKMIALTDNQELGVISEKTIRNIAKWSLNGASKDEIADNMELTKKQFKTLCTLCPAIVYVMQNGQAIAEMMLVGTAYQMAMGYKLVKQVPIQEKIYDNNGRVVGSETKIVEITEQLPPDTKMLQYFMEHKLSEKFGKEKIDESAEVKEIVDNLSAEQMVEIEKRLKDGN